MGEHTPKWGPGIEVKEGILKLNHKLEGLLTEIQRKKQSLLGKVDSTSKSQEEHLLVFTNEIKKAMSTIAPIVSIVAPEEDLKIN